METLEITIGQSKRGLCLEPQEQPNTFKIYALDPVQDWFEHERPRNVDLPVDSCLGTITVRDETDFDFEGAGAFTGQEMQSIAAQVSLHPLFKKDEL
ncbi:MAG TPA: hypothetical protein VIM89_15560 [Mucilaginibacter sp.]